MKFKTTLQELKEYCLEVQKSIVTDDARPVEEITIQELIYEDGRIRGYWEVINKIQELLPKEEEIIKNAYYSGECDENLYLHKKTRGYKNSEDYYKQNYKK